MHTGRSDLRVDIGDLLDSARLARPTVLRSNDTPVRALPKFLHELVLGVDNERRVQGCKSMPLHLVFGDVTARWAKTGEDGG